jgi:hypothetical protein
VERPREHSTFLINSDSDKRFTAKYAARSMKMETRYIEYCGKFRPMGMIWLEQTNIIGAADINDYIPK